MVAALLNEDPKRGLPKNRVILFAQDGTEMYLANAVHKDGYRSHMQGDKKEPFAKQDKFVRIERYGPYMTNVKQDVEYFAKPVLGVVRRQIIIIFHCAGEQGLHSTHHCLGKATGVEVLNLSLKEPTSLTWLAGLVSDMLTNMLRARDPYTHGNVEVGNEHVVQGRFRKYFGDVLDTIFASQSTTEQNINLRFADFKCTPSTYSGTPDVTLKDNNHALKIVGELSNRNAGRPSTDIRWIKLYTIQTNYATVLSRPELLKRHARHRIAQKNKRRKAPEPAALLVRLSLHSRLCGSNRRPYRQCPDASWWINNSNGEVKLDNFIWIRPSRKTIKIETRVPEQIHHLPLGHRQLRLIAMTYQRN
ncbi:hypothetical protein CNMCM6106_007358 [Aspergillus hiratsukae]|uniref:Uncharacterized protein n=1 Tax=Aspergillus hiratsukae TaxID=1194566 RepID=A0A8H6V0P6_9EURO|nr:hypothetical protein CNMCM6106_007358 [Aspergillus hiratsukae]